MPLTPQQYFSTMTLTKSQRKDIVKYILEKVFDLPNDSDLHKALSYNQLFTPEGMLSCSDSDYETLTFEDNNKQPCTLKKGTIGLVKSFKAFVAYHNSIGQPIQNGDWMKITQDEFDKF